MVGECGASKFMTYKCKVCGITFQADICAKRKYCSLKCYYIDKKETSKGEYSPFWKGGKVKRICQVCGKEFKVKSYTVKKGLGLFCSGKCRAVMQSKNRRGDKIWNWGGGPIVTKCLFCGKEFTVSRGNHNAGKNKYCSMSCNGERKINGNFKISTRIRDIVKGNKWRKQILKRDNFSCQKCGRPDNLQVHHIKKLSNIVADIKNLIKDIGFHPIIKEHVPLWDISNGITLCVKCHKSVHSRGAGAALKRPGMNL